MGSIIPRQSAFRSFLKDRFSLVRENRKLIAQFIFSFLFIALGIWFLKHEQSELGEVKNVLLASHWQYVIFGIGLTIFYITGQGMMYQLAFLSVGSNIPITSAILLFLKRNFVSIFIPAGGVTSLAFFTSAVENKEVTKTKIHFASSIYAFIGILSVVIVSIPVFVYAFIDGVTGVGEWFALAAMVLFIFALFLSYKSIMNSGYLFRLIIRFFPSTIVFFEDLQTHTINTRHLIFTLVVSFIIDFICIAEVYISMLALNIHPNLFYALMGYFTAVVLPFISPFMRGLGAVEVSLSFVLTRFGYSNIEAVSITFLYRFFEFWLPLVTGALSFLMKINKLLMRIIPALLIFILGIINIISVITPAIHERVQRLEDFIPLDAIAASNYLVLVSGIILLLTAVFLLKGLRNAWWIALALSIISFLGHLTKAIDYEEASVALAVILMLVFLRKEYRIRGNPRMHTIGIATAFMTIFAVLVYGVIGFYFLDKKHFGIDFNTWESIRYTFQNFFQVGNTGLIPASSFARDFLLSIRISGFLSLSFLVFTILRPYIYKKYNDPEGIGKAKELVAKYGTSGMDYFKVYIDKIIFAPPDLEAFISYRIAGSFAVALENPVAETPENMKQCIILFDKFCYENGLKSVYYRVPEESLPVYKDLSKKSMFIGQEGIVDLHTFSLEGGKKKALRNALNKLTERGYKASIHIPPVKDGLIQKLKAVSEEWLKFTGRNEIIFSQGVFNWNELKQQTIITVENAEEMVIAFLNIIPDYSPGEGIYDLIRKTAEAPHGVLDFILVELFKFLKSKNYSTVNLGFAPLSGLDDPHTFQEKSMKFAYERLRSFSQYKGLRNFKEKFFPTWYNKYLIYSDDYDLFQIPAVLTKVIKPPHE